MSGANGGARDTRPKGRDRFSGLGRVARSRSDAPGFIVSTAARFIMFGTITTDTIGIVIRIVVTVSVIAVATSIVVADSIVEHRLSRSGATA